MKIFVIFLVLFQLLFNLVKSGHIYSWDLGYDYDQDGDIVEIRIFFKLETTIGPSDYIQL